MRQLIDGQIVSYFIYFLGSITIGTGIGLLALSIEKYIHISHIGCFLAGFSLTPYVIGSFMLIMSLVPIKLPRVFYIAPLYLLTVLIFILKRGVWLPVLKKYILKIGTLSFYIRELFLIWGICLFSMFIYPVLPINTLWEIYGTSGVELVIKGLITIGILTLGLFLLKKEMISMRQIIKTNDEDNSYVLMWKLELEHAGDKCFKKEKKIEVRFNWLRRGYLVVKLLLPIIIMFVYCIVVQYIYTYFSTHTSWNRAFRCLCFSTLIGGITFFLAVLLSLLYGQYERDKYSFVQQICRGFISIISSLVIVILLRQACISSYSPVVGADANEYLSAALRYASDLRFSSITLFEGTTDGSLIPLMHHPAWIMYLGNALLHTPTGQIGTTVDFAARLSFQMTYLYLFAAIIACASAFIKSNKRVLLLSAALPLAFNLFSYIYTAASKDAFRLIPLMLLPVILLGVEKELHERNNRWVFIVPFITGCFVMMGHPINALTAVSIVLAFSLYLLGKGRLFCRQTVSLYSATAIGALVGCFQIIWAFLKTGSLMGNGYDAETLLTDTPYLHNFLEFTESRLKGTETYWERLLLILTRDNGILCVPAIIGAFIVICMMCISLKKKRDISEFSYLALVVICNSILLTDIIQWSNTTLSKWCVMNVRYTFQLYAFWGVFLAVGISEAIDVLRCISFKTMVSVGVVLGLYTSLPLAVVWLVMPQYTPMYSYRLYNSVVDEYVQAMMASYEYPESRILIDNFYANYYLNNTALTFLSERATQIRKASTLEELDQALDAEKIDVIMLTSSLRDVYWKDTPLEDYINNKNYTIPVDEEGGTWIYVRKKVAEGK